MDAKTKNYTGWQSDVIVDMIKRYGFPYITLNPGASFRGLHDSLVNYGNNEPPMMLCNHEEIAVQIAHGYAKATGKPMAVILHNLVGLLHACMAIYYAYLDRVPIFIMGATGPMDEAKRRPHIDWTHTALVQGNAVRDYTKWDYQPTSIHGVPESFARAYSIMMTEPKGPIYMCYDAALQEAPMTEKVELPPDFARAGAGADGAGPDARSRRSPTSCSRPSTRCCWPSMPAGVANGFNNIVELAETAGAGGVGRQQRAQLPEQASALPEHGQGRRSSTPTSCSASTCKDWEKQLTELNSTTRQLESLVAPELRLCRDRLRRDRHQQMGDGLLPHAAVLGARARRHRDRHPGAHPHLQGAHRQGRRASRRRSRTARSRSASATTRSGPSGSRTPRRTGTPRPITFQRLALEVWEVIKDEDWVLTANDLKHEVRKIWDFDKPYRHPGVELGTSTQIGISLGVALACKEKGRLAVDINPDGDLMFDAGALWIAAKYEIPMLVVMHNNRAYYNDWAHQIRMAKLRGTDEAKAHIGMDLFGPEPDFGALARSMGCYGEGPIDKPEGHPPGAPSARIAEVKKGRLALVDTITQHR